MWLHYKFMENCFIILSTCDNCYVTFCKAWSRIIQGVLKWVHSIYWSFKRHSDHKNGDLWRSFRKLHPASEEMFYEMHTLKFCSHAPYFIAQFKRQHKPGLNNNFFFIKVKKITIFTGLKGREKLLNFWIRSSDFFLSILNQYNLNPQKNTIS